MDVVYTVSPDPIHQNIELRYSIRSLVKHLDKIDKIFIVGHCPDFLKGVIHIPAADDHKHNIARNIYDKIMLACNDKRVSASFLCISDDHFLNQDYSIETFPNHVNFTEMYLEDLTKRITPNNYFKPFLDATITALQAKGLPTVNYNVHSPIIYNKKLFKKVMPAFDWTGKTGFLAKSLYGNSLNLPGLGFIDNKIATPKTKAALKRYIDRGFIYSTNEFSVNDEMKEVWQELYPESVPWEK